MCGVWLTGIALGLLSPGTGTADGAGVEGGVGLAVGLFRLYALGTVGVGVDGIALPFNLAVDPAPLRDALDAIRIELSTADAPTPGRRSHA